MQGFPINFNVYANSKEEADEATLAIKDFITESANRGIAITANKISRAIKKWGANPFVINYFKK